MISEAIKTEIKLLGADILLSQGMRSERSFIQHGEISVYEHCINVACFSLLLVHLLRLTVNRRALIRGALLHDYFLYDWHKPDPVNPHRLHGWRHAHRALENASRDFLLSSIERDIIAKHMFPLNLRLPKYRESVIVCAADKLCAVLETVSSSWIRKQTGWKNQSF